MNTHSTDQAFPGSDDTRTADEVEQHIREANLNIPEMTDEQIDEQPLPKEPDYDDKITFARAILAARDAQYAAISQHEADRARQEPVAPEWQRNLLGEWNATYPRMDIYAKPGTPVVFDGRGGHDSEKKHAEKVLKLRHTYEVDGMGVGSCSSSERLKGIDGVFNTCLFAAAPHPAPTNPAAQERAEPVAPAVGAERDRLLETFAEWARQVSEQKAVPTGIRKAAAGLYNSASRLSATPPAPAQPAPESKPEQAEAPKCPACNGTRVIGIPGAPCEFCKLYGIATLPPAIAAGDSGAGEREARIAELEEAVLNLTQALREATEAPPLGPENNPPNANDRYRYLLGLLIEKGVLTDKRYSNGTWVLRGIYGIDDSGLKGAGRTPEEAVNNAIVANQLDPEAAGKFWRDTNAALATKPQAEQDAEKVVPSDILKYAKSMQKQGYSGPLMWASKIIDWVIEQGAARASNRDRKGGV